MHIEPRIFVATLFGTGLIASAYFLASNHSPVPKEPLVESSQAVKRSFITIEDKNNDGIPDWQEHFVEDIVYLDQPSSSTVTSDVLVDLTTRFLESKSRGEDFSVEAYVAEQITKEKIAQLEQLYTRTDLKIIVPTNEKTMKQYGNDLATAILAYPLPRNARPELEILNEALEVNNPALLSQLDPIITSYEATLAGFENTTVPDEFIEEHLMLMNSTRRLIGYVKDFRHVYTDTLPSLISTKNYAQDASMLYTTILETYKKLLDRKIQWESEDPASKLIRREYYDPNR